jgi:hypothetical protein
MVFPPTFLISRHNALANKYSKVKDDIKSKALVSPWRQHLQKFLLPLMPTTVCNKRTAIAGTPSGHGSKSDIVGSQREFWLYSF